MTAPPDNLVIWNGVTRHDLPPKRVIEQTVSVPLKSVVILGWDEAGDIYFASSMADGADVLWLMEWAKRELLKVEPP